MQELHQCNATKKSRTRNNPHPAHLFLLSYTQKLTAKGKLILALTGSFGFLLALYAGLLIMLTPTDLSEDARARALTSFSYTHLSYYIIMSDFFKRKFAFF